eukprot:TRINITY_DN446_c1_g1_i1.p1 TRINITY_DN446_c1_g1~~TRINITY_DN446_c1_g1_i1.p1  ORF type:complete len:162 (-),score=30.76 TRINITY_DN446_c1_g1_i1:422-907(-)
MASPLNWQSFVDYNFGAPSNISTKTAIFDMAGDSLAASQSFKLTKDEAMSVAAVLIDDEIDLEKEKPRIKIAGREYEVREMQLNRYLIAQSVSSPKSPESGRPSSPASPSSRDKARVGFVCFRSNKTVIMSLFTSDDKRKNDQIMFDTVKKLADHVILKGY